jgi:hypothetical protein
MNLVSQSSEGTLHQLNVCVSSILDPGMYYRQGMILIMYVNNALCFRPDMQAIESLISKLENLGYGLTREEGNETTNFAFLGVSITPDPLTKLLKLTQRGLIKKVLGATEMSDYKQHSRISFSHHITLDLMPIKWLVLP